MSDETRAPRAVASDEDRIARLVLKTATDLAIITTDLSGTITRWSPGAERLLGFGAARMLGMGLGLLFTPEDLARGVPEAQRHQTRAEGRTEHEHWHVRADGSRFWGAAVVTRVEDEVSGEHLGYLHLLSDRTRERDLRQFTELSPAILWRGNPDGSLSYLNTYWYEYTGQTPEQALPWGWADVIHPEDVAALNAVWADARTRGVLYETEARLRRHDGTYRWFLIRARPVRDPAGHITEWLGSDLDMQDLKVAQEALRTSEERFRSVADATPGFLWTADRHGQLDYTSPRWHEYSGSRPDDSNGQGWAAFVHPEDRERAFGAWAAAVAAGTRYETEFRLRMAPGNYRWWLARALPVHGSQGEIKYWAGVCTDLDEIVAARETLTRSREQLETLVAERTADRERMWRLSTDVMLVADFQARICAVNPAWTRLFGWAEHELLGRDFMDLIHPEDRAATLAEVARLEQGITTLRFENRYQHKDGGYRPLAWTAVPDERFIHAVGRDMSAEKQAAAELEQAQEALRQAQKMEAVGQLTGGIAHDFNNLLTGIIGSLDMMQRRAQQGKTVDLGRYVTAAITSANRAAALTHRLLAFSRRQPLNPKTVNANQLVVGMEELLRRTLGETIRLEMVAAGGLWLTRCDPHQLENAILNLAINARDAMPQGGQLTVETCNTRLDSAYAAQLRDVRAGQYVCISVTDTGVGMPPDVIAKAFEPFFTTKPLGQGTGLGLSMIYGFTRQSEGYCRIYSEVGQGTTVKLYLPRHYGPSEADEAARQAAQSLPAGHGEVVLVVEDEAGVRDFVVEVLGDLGYRAVEAVDGPSGLKLLQSAMHLDLLVTDVGLPGLNGRQLADAARQSRPDLKVLFMTGYAENAVIANGFLEPGMEMLTKPFAVDVLTQRIRALLEHSD